MVQDIKDKNQGDQAKIDVVDEASVEPLFDTNVLFPRFGHETLFDVLTEKSEQLDLLD